MGRVKNADEPGLHIHLRRSRGVKHRRRLGPETWRRSPRLLSGRSRPLINLVTLAVTLLFSYIAFSGIHLGQAWHALRTSDYLWLLPALLALGLAMGARALRWRSLFAPGRRPPLATVSNAMMVGYLYNNILPARSGEVARVIVLARRSRAQPAEIVGTTVLERLCDVVGILVIFFVAQPWLPAVSWFRPAAIVAVVPAVMVAAAAIVLAIDGDGALRVLVRPLRRLPFLSSEHLEHAVADLTLGLSALRNPGVAFLGLLWTLVAWMLTAVLAYFVSAAFHLHLPFGCGAPVAVAVGLAMILPAPPAAVGVVEGAALIGLQAYGLSHSAALPYALVLYALVLHLVNFIPFIVVGVLLLRHNSRHAPSPLALGAAARGGPSPTAAAQGGPLPAELPATHQAAPVQLQSQQGTERLQPVYDRGRGPDRRTLLGVDRARGDLGDAEVEMHDLH
jgi:glycosyltransferase 2 family protein